MKIKYGRSRIEKVEECIRNCLGFKENDYKEEDEFLLAMEELDLREKELDMSHEEWISVWMLHKTKKMKSLEMIQCQVLRDVVEAGGETVVKNFGEKFRELKVEGLRKKMIEALLNGFRKWSKEEFLR